jgi:hypothetical protein
LKYRGKTHIHRHELGEDAVEVGEKGHDVFCCVGKFSNVVVLGDLRKKAD